MICQSNSINIPAIGAPMMGSLHPNAFVNGVFHFCIVVVYCSVYGLKWVLSIHNLSLL